ncbi:MAG: LacI family DNA-binding transcriptional regulator [Opitutaceae bacterium]|nr:LacI family DNA-binding transcriptional regulator [Opitutaceae bacterium]
MSDALRGKGRVSAATIRRVRHVARSLGYKPNPLVAQVLGSINRARGVAFHGTLAVVDIHEPDHPHGPFPRELVAGARARAAEMGFSIAEFVVGPDRLTWGRLDSILQSRGAHGIIVLPAWFAADLSNLDWSRYAGLYTDYVTTGPELHSVCPDHYESMLSLLRRLQDRGYRRPGLILQRQRDERIRHRQSGAFCAFQTRHGRDEIVPPLITRETPEFSTEFEPWFRRHRPDVLLSHFPAMREWARACAPVPAPDLVLLNTLDRSYPCAALDLQPRVIGARAAELVVGQILRNELGVPAWPSRTSVEARWVEGPTVRPASDVKPARTPARA